MMTDTPQSPDNAQELEPVAWGLFNYGCSGLPTSDFTMDAGRVSSWMADYVKFPDVYIKPFYSQATVDGLIKERDALKADLEFEKEACETYIRTVKKYEKALS